MSLLLDLAERLAASGEERLLIHGDDLDPVQTRLIEPLCDLSLLSPAEPARSLICDGCEHGCPMETELAAMPGGTGTAAFIVCDKRDDIGRVPVDASRLRRWQISVEHLATVLARLLRTDRPPRAIPRSRAMWLGTAAFGEARAEIVLCGLLDEAPDDADLVITLAEPGGGSTRPAVSLCGLLVVGVGQLNINQGVIDRALVGRFDDQRIAFEILFERRQIILLNRANGSRRALATPNFASSNDVAFQVLFDNPGTRYSLAELRDAAGDQTIADLHKMVENLKFTGLLKQVFFDVSKQAIRFERTVTFGQLAALGVDPLDLH